MSRIEGRIVNLGSPLPCLVEGNRPERPPRRNQPRGESGLIERLERPGVKRESVAVPGGPLVHVDDRHADSVLLERQGRDETHRTGADDEDLRIHGVFLPAH